MSAAPLFRSVPRSFLRSHLAKMEYRTLSPGETLLSPGQPNSNIYVVLKGRLRIHLKLTDPEPIELFGIGDCVGEMSTLLDDGQVSAHVIADTLCELLVIDHATVWLLINDSQKIARNLLNILIRRMRTTNRMMAESMEHKLGFTKHADIDDLTGLYSRRGMIKDFKKQILRSTMDNEATTIILLEVDHFQQFSSQYGSLGGDQALRTLAQTILDSMRPRDRAAHYRGEKFVVLLPNTFLADGCIVAERFRINASKASVMTPSGDVLPPITISLGLCENRAEESLEQLIARAETALLMAKSTGGNCLRI